MIRIIGEAPGLIKQTACRNCATLLEYTQSDVRKRTGSDYDGGRFVIEFIDCPKCSNEVILRSS